MISEFPKFIDEFFPACLDLMKDFLKNSITFILMHFEMKLTEIVISKNSLPALSMFAVFLTIFLDWAHWISSTALRRAWSRATGKLKIWIILPKVEAFSWVNLTTDSHLEVLIRDLSVAIGIKFVEKFLKLLLGYAT